MLIWLIKDGEILPIEPGARLMRTGMLARELVSRGHSVVWWSSTFSHQRKRAVARGDTEIRVWKTLRLKLLDAGSYRKNISFSRYVHHRRLARRFSEESRRMARPDAIVCAFPQIDLTFEAVRMAQGRSVPAIVDIRDLWPDALVGKLSTWKARLLGKVLRFQRRRVGLALRGAQGLAAVSEGYLDWGLKCAGRERSTWDRVFHIGYSDQGHGPGASRSQRLAELESKLGGKVVFTYIGSFGQSYELELVCEVARRALRIDMAPELHFLIVGDGESMKQIAGMASELSNITLTGWLDGDELRGVMRLSSVGLLPYRSVAHTLPNKAFEYLSAGLPVISSLEGEMVNIIAEADIGASYSCGDVAGLCAAVVRLGTDSELRARQSANARRVFAERFRAEDIYRSYANYIEMMIQMSRRGQGMSGSPSPADGSL